MARPRDLSALSLSLNHLLNDTSMTRLQHAGGRRAKIVALEEAERDLGRDRAFSGMRRGRRRRALNAGYDVDPGVTFINLRPKGLWNLANEGRRRTPAAGKVFASRTATGRQRNRNRQNVKQALDTPWGPRYSVKASTTRGHRTLTDAEDRWDTELPEAVSDEIGKIIRELF